MLISVHFAVNLIILFRDRFAHLPVRLDKTGSNCCEDTFSALGSKVMNKHNFCLGEGLERLAHISRTEQIKVDEAAPNFAKSRRKQKNWHVGNPIDGEPGNLQDYASIPDAKCEEAWELGLIDARKLAESVGIKESLVRKNKWDEPWHFFSAEAELSRLSAEKDKEDSEEAPEEETDQPLTSVLLPSLEDQTPPDPDATQVVAPLPGDAKSDVLRDLTDEQSIEIRLSLLSAL
jgi:hypothetical protein